MFRLIKLFLLLLVSNAFAYESLDISKIPTTYNAMHSMYCVQDENNSFTFDAILKKDDATQLQKSNLGYIFKTYWCKLYVTNSSQSEKNIILSNPRPGVDSIEVNIYKNNSIESFHLGDMVSLENRSYPGVFSNFELRLESNESATIISKYYTVANLELAWNIQTFSDFMMYENLNFILIFVFAGFIFAMMIYKFFIYFHIRDKAYLIYAIMMITILISQASLQGSMHYFLHDIIDYYTISISSSIFTHLFVVLMWLFAFYFFDIKKSSRFYYPLIVVIAYNSLVTLLYTASYFSVDLLRLTPLIIFIAFVEAIFLFAFALVMFIQKKAGSGYFLIGHLLYIAAILNYMLVLDGALEFSLYYRHSASLGVFMVIMFMSLALSARFKAIKDESEANKEHIQRNRQYTMIGTTISYISHQWKQPLSILSSQIMSMRAQAEHTPNAAIFSLKNKLSEMENSVSFLNETLYSIQKLFSVQDSFEQEFKLFTLFSELEKNFSEQLRTNDIAFTLDIADKQTLFGNKNLFTHAINNLIQNSIEAFSTQERANKFIHLKLTEEKNNTLALSIEDNAGGIQLDDINNAFEPNISNKSFGMGIGLSLTKNIIESKFNAKIDVEITSHGTKFTLNKLQKRVKHYK